LQSTAALDQQPVAVVVAEGVVDLLEPVHVEHGQRSRDQVAVGVSDRLAATMRARTATQLDGTQRTAEAGT